MAVSMAGHAGSLFVLSLWPANSTVAAIFSRGLLVVAGLAKRLPVVHPPKQFEVPAVGNDVVNRLGRSHLLACETTHAERMLGEVCFAFSSPSTAVPSPRGRASLLLGVLLHRRGAGLAVSTGSHHVAATGPSTDARCTGRHEGSGFPGKATEEDGHQHQVAEQHPRHQDPGCPLQQAQPGAAGITDAPQRPRDYSWLADSRLPGGFEFLAVNIVANSSSRCSLAAIGSLIFGVWPASTLFWRSHRMPRMP